MKNKINLREKLKDRKIVYRLCFLIMCGISLVLHFSITDEYFNIKEFGFFTVQSNIFCFIVMTILVMKDFKGKDTVTPILVYFKGMATSAILCTGYIYHFAESINIYALEDTGVIGIPAMDLFAHYIVPVMFVLDWIVFQPKGLFKKSYIITWLAFPVFYVICFLTRCFCNDATAFKNVKKFPYFFMDYETLGPLTFCKYIGMIAFAILIINGIIYLLDLALAQKERSIKR